MKSLKTYIVLESNLQVKRKYSTHDPIHVGANAPVRNKILGFIAEKGSCSSEDLKEFIKSTNEESGKNTGTSWLTKNSRYITVVEKEGVKSYKLSKLGQRVVKASTVNE